MKPENQNELHVEKWIRRLTRAFNLYGKKKQELTYLRIDKALKLPKCPSIDEMPKRRAHQQIRDKRFYRINNYAIKNGFPIRFEPIGHSRGMKIYTDAKSIAAFEGKRASYYGTKRAKRNAFRLEGTAKIAELKESVKSQKLLNALIAREKADIKARKAAMEFVAMYEENPSDSTNVKMLPAGK